MADTINGRKRIRKQFGSILEVARDAEPHRGPEESYDDFLMVEGARRGAS